MSGFSSDARQKGSCIRDFTHDIKHGFLSFPSGVAAVPAGDVTLPEQDKAVVKRQMPVYRARARTLTSRASALRGRSGGFDADNRRFKVADLLDGLFCNDGLVNKAKNFRVCEPLLWASGAEPFSNNQLELCQGSLRF